jgi:hypothetical protein
LEDPLLVLDEWAGVEEAVVVVVVFVVVSRRPWP